MQEPAISNPHWDQLMSCCHVNLEVHVCCVSIGAIDCAWKLNKNRKYPSTIWAEAPPEMRLGAWSPGFSPAEATLPPQKTSWTSLRHWHLTGQEKFSHIKITSFPLVLVLVSPGTPHTHTHTQTHTLLFQVMPTHTQMKFQTKSASATCVCVEGEGWNYFIYAHARYVALDVAMVHSDPSDDLLWLQCEAVDVLRRGEADPSRGEGAKVHSQTGSKSEAVWQVWTILELFVQYLSEIQGTYLVKQPASIPPDSLWHDCSICPNINTRQKAMCCIFNKVLAECCIYGCKRTLVAGGQAPEPTHILVWNQKWPTWLCKLYTQW